MALDLWTAARQARDECDLPRALELYRQCLETGEVLDADLLDEYAELRCTTGDFAGAIEVYMRSIRVAPNSNPQKYFALGQLHHGKKALWLYTQGLRLLIDDASQAAKAEAAMAELYMTDLW
jgi:tetratricopeptide (TPR) repeat protein